jgi:hypothetical protein
MSFPGEGNLSLSDSRGLSLEVIPGSIIVPRGKKVSCSMPLSEIISAGDGINIELSWSV